jgi:hypothetical protein
MKNFNSALFEKEGYDSGELAVLVSVYHKFSKIGLYQCSIFSNDILLRRFRISVEEENIQDLNQNLDIKDMLRSAKETIRASINKHLGFYVSSGNQKYGLRISYLGDTDDIKEEWDNMKLRRGDIFAATMLREGAYSFSNSIYDHSGEILVKDIKERSLEKGILVECSDKFKPDRIKISSTNVIFFIIDNDLENRITISPIGRDKEIQKKE